MKVIACFLLLFLFFFNFENSFAQKQANIWYFGNKAGLDFSSGSPVPLTNGQLSSQEGCASICDKTTGQLLFYTDGDKVWNRNHQVMPNGNGLGGNYSSTQSAIVVPRPSSNTQYYIFTVDAWAGTNVKSAGNGGMNLNLVDITLNGGLGDVVTKSQLIVSPTCEKLTATPHCNGTDYWVVTHGWKSDSIFAYLLTSAGLSAAPVISQPGIRMKDIGSKEAFEAIGYMKISPDGKKIALAAHSYIRCLEIGDFDNKTGIASNFIIDSSFSSVSVLEGLYGVSFSPDNSKLYLSIQDRIMNIGTGHVYQYDLSAGSAAEVLASRTLINTSTGIYGALQLAPDGKIYMAKFNSPTLDIISNPNGAGASCNYVKNGIATGIVTGTVMQHYSELGLPDFIESFVVPQYKAVLSYRECGVTYQVSFVDSMIREPVTALWNFGDSASGVNNTSSLPDPQHTFSAKGTFTVSVTIDYACGNFTVTKTITTTDSFHVDAGTDQAICAGDNIQLQAKGGTNHAWSPSSGLSCTNCINPVATPSATTTYTVQIDDGQGCSDFDEVVITVFDIVTAAASPSDTTICLGESVQLQASGGAQYQWLPADYLSDDSVADPVCTPLQSVTYLLVAIVGNCPQDTTVVTIRVEPPPAIDAGPDLTIFPGTRMRINAGSSAAGSFLWSPKDGLDDPNLLQPFASPTQTTTYIIQVTDLNGCRATDTVIIFLENGRIYFPNVFTPNGDGLNDEFRYYAPGIKAIDLKIYNRWGELVFHSESLNVAWDGTFRQMPASVGAYVYVAKATQYDGKEFIEKGNVTLLR